MHRLSDRSGLVDAEGLEPFCHLEAKSVSQKEETSNTVTGNLVGSRPGGVC